MKFFFKFILWLLIVLLLLITIFIGYLLYKPEQSEVTKKLLAYSQQYNSNLDRDPYFDFIGLDANSTSNPTELGKLRYHQFWQQDPMKSISKVTKNSVKNLPIGIQSDKNVLDSELINLLEGIGNQYALNKLSSIYVDKKKILDAYQKNDYLINRYLKIINNPNYKNLVLPNTSKDFVSDQIKLFINLNRLHIAYLVLNGDTEGIHTILVNLMMHIDQTQITERFMVMKMIDETVDILHMMNLEKKHLYSVQPFTQKALSLKQVYAALFINIDQSFREIENPKQEADEKNITSKLVSMLFFDKNQTSNMFANYFQASIDLSELSYKDFKTKVNENVVLQNSTTKVKNYIGNHIYNKSSTLPLKQYVVMNRLILDHKIQLFNILNQQQSWDVKKLNSNSEGYEFYINKDQLCIRSPYVSNKKFNKNSCLLAELS